VATLRPEHRGEAAEAGLAEEPTLDVVSRLEDVVDDVDEDRRGVGEVLESSHVREQVDLGSVGRGRGGPADAHVAERDDVLLVVALAHAQLGRLVDDVW